MICVGNGAYEGGGFKLNPDARITDGLLDVCMVDSVSVARALRVLPSAISGAHIRHPEVRLQRARRIVVEAAAPFAAHVDGEIVGNDLVSVSASVVPAAVNVISWNGEA